MEYWDNNGYPTDLDHPWHRDTGITDLRGTPDDPRWPLLREAYREGNLDALLEALRICDDAHCEMPEWVSSAVAAFIWDGIAQPPKGPGGRHSRWATQRIDILNDLSRYWLVCDFLEQGWSLEEARAKAAGELVGSEEADEAIKKAFDRVRKGMKLRPGLYMIFPHHVKVSNP